MEDSTRIGEVVASSTAHFTTQCYELYGLPPLGSLVRTKEGPNEIFAIVCQAETSGLEPGRKAVARGHNQNSEEDIYSSNPQLEKLLKSEFEALVVGHREATQIFRYLPPRPARIHSFVYSCSTQEVREFTSSFEFLDLLINTQLEIPPEELIAACLREISRSAENRETVLVQAGRRLAELLSGDIRHLKVILERIRL